MVDPGEYTLTVTGMGDYTGAKTVHFYVYKNNGDTFPLQIDREFQEDEDGYFYVNMPGDGQSVYDKNGNEITIPAENNPKTHREKGRKRYGKGLVEAGRRAEIAG